VKGILGKKLGMTQVFDERGESMPVTVIEAGPCWVTQVKTAEKDGYNAVQLGFGDVKPTRLSRGEMGHLGQLEVDAALRLAASQLAEAGWEVVECDTPPMREAMQLQLLLWMSEYQYNGGAAVLEENDPDANFVYAQLLQHCPTPDLTNLMEALQRRARLAREWQLFLTRYPLLLCPVSAEAPFPDQLDVESTQAFGRVLEAQMPQIALPLTGMPGMSVATASGAAPMGVQLVAARFREDILLDAAAEIEARNAPLEIADPH